jgi:hypothetical protein
MYQLNGQELLPRLSFIAGEVQYPSDWLDRSTAEERAAIGIVEVADPVLPDERFWKVTKNADGTVSVEPKDIATLRAKAIATVKAHRQSALDTFPKSTGVSEVYAENLRAAQAVAAGAGETTIMRDGTSAAAYLAGMAAGMGMSGAQFGAYVLAENTAAAIKAREIEAEYVRLVYTFIPACSFEQVQTVADGYRDFCAARAV